MHCLLRNKYQLLPLKNHTNSFDFLRLVFAAFVIITHSFVLSGTPGLDPLASLTSGQVNFSYIGLRGFFVISGFLIYQSFERSATAGDFFWKRFLRIFPGLIFVSMITVFIIGPIFTSFPLSEYFSYKSTYLVISESVDLFFQKNFHSLPGLFAHNPRPNEVNGSLWTISYEFLFYTGFLVLFIIKLKRLVLPLLVILLVVLAFVNLVYIQPYFKYEYFIGPSEIGIRSICDFGMFFITGSLFAYFKYDKMSQRFHIAVALSSLMVIIVLIFWADFNSLAFLLLCPLILSFGSIKSTWFEFIKRTGDVSYGMYLSSFVIQQVLMSMNPFSPYLLLSLSLPISYLYGFLSWHFIERQAMNYKDIFRPLKLKPVLG